MFAKCTQLSIRRPAFPLPIEQHLARGIRAVLNDIAIRDTIPESDALREAMSTLEHFIPQVLREIHVEWKHESLDAVFPEITTKTGELEIEIIGTCIIMSDQTMVPTHTWIRVSEQDDIIQSMQCKLGELAGKTMKRVPYGGNSGCRIEIGSRLDSVQWACDVAFGLGGQSHRP